MNIDLIKEYIALQKEKNEHGDKVNDLNARIMALEPDILEALADSGIDRITVDGMTLYAKKAKAFPKYKEAPDGTLYGKEQLLAALHATDMADMCPETVNASRFNAYLQELYDEDDPLPEQLAEIIEIVTIPQLGKRKA